MSKSVVVLTILFVFSACVFRSGRENESSPPTSSANASTNEQVPTKEFFNTDKTENKKEDNGDFVVVHIAAENTRYAEFAEKIKNEKTLEKAADKLNRSLILPQDITLKTKNCDEANALYNENDQSVTICYELMEHLYKIFRGAGNNPEKSNAKMFDAVRFAFLHETAHALIVSYQLPITGSEEDAADRCSSFLNLTELGEDGVNAVLAAADAFEAESKNTTNKQNMADEHLLQEQRFYNSLCMIYGSNPEKYAYLLNEDYLPKDRAARCPQEYERSVSSWSKLLAPWRKN